MTEWYLRPRVVAPTFIAQKQKDFILFLYVLRVKISNCNLVRNVRGPVNGVNLKSSDLPRFHSCSAYIFLDSS